MATLVKYIRSIVKVEAMGNPIGDMGEVVFRKAMKFNTNIKAENLRLYEDIE